MYRIGGKNTPISNTKLAWNGNNKHNIPSFNNENISTKKSPSKTLNNWDSNTGYVNETQIPGHNLNNNGNVDNHYKLEMIEGIQNIMNMSENNYHKQKRIVIESNLSSIYKEHLLKHIESLPRNNNITDNNVQKLIEKEQQIMKLLNNSDIKEPNKKSILREIFNLPNNEFNSNKIKKIIENSEKKLKQKSKKDLNNKTKVKIKATTKKFKKIKNKTGINKFAFEKFDNEGDLVGRFKGNHPEGKMPTIPRRLQHILKKIFEKHGYIYKEVPKKKSKKGKILDFDPATNRTTIKIGMSGSNKEKFKLYQFRNKNGKLLEKNNASPTSNNPYSRLVWHINNTDDFKEQLSKIHSNWINKLEELLLEYNILSDAPIISGNSKKERIIKELKEKANKAKVTIRTNKNNDLEVIKGRKKNSNEQNIVIPVLNKNDVLITKGKMVLPEFALTSNNALNFKKFRNKHFKKSSGKEKTGVWTLK